MSKQIQATLDSIATEVQALGKRYPKLASTMNKYAARIDVVTNSIQAGAIRRAGEERGGERLEGEFGPEDEHQDSFEATNYHKTPIGNDSMSKAIGKNPADILADLDFAQNSGGAEGHEINIQAGRFASSWPFRDLSPKAFVRLAQNGHWDLVGKAARLARRMAGEGSMEVDEDETGSADDLSTADLAETGDESQNAPIDASQEGDTLQFFGTEPAGSGTDSGHHRGARRRQMLRRASEADAPVIVENAERLHDGEPGENVERDQSLGGLTAGRQAHVKVYRPTHVPKEMHSYWHGAAQHLSRKGSLLKANGQVDYQAINGQYQRLLGHLTRVASAVDAKTGN
jgi:hypothetical protein